MDSLIKEEPYQKELRTILERASEYKSSELTVGLLKSLREGSTLKKDGSTLKKDDTDDVFQ